MNDPYRMPALPSTAVAADAAVVRRGFVQIEEGQVHYREAGVPVAGQPPLVLLHASPGSSRTLAPLLRAFAAHRHVVALDTPGNGDSCAPVSDIAELPYFADALLRAITAMGMDRFDLYGTHTGANIACEIAIGHPARVRALIVDGIALYSAQEQAELLAHHVPNVSIDRNGSQLNLIWHFVRDAYLFWPWYRSDAEHRRVTGLPDANELHDKVVDVLKAARTFHIPYRAALGYQKERRLPLVRVPTLVACAKTDMLFAYFDRVCRLMPHARSAATRGVGSPEAVVETAGVFERFYSDPG
jgi:pimeloyl-ACP methyl ester carboxylesterase